MPNKTSVFINGAGLAGSACAIRLRQLGHSVILIDKAKFPRPKLCGEFLGPDAMPLLKRLGLLEIIQERCQVRINTVNLHNQFGSSLSIKLSWIRTDYPYALAIPRDILDTILLYQAQNLGAFAQEKCVIEAFSYSAISKTFEISVKSCDFNIEKHYQVSSDILIDAAGRNSHLYKHANTKDDTFRKNKSPAAIEPYVGIQCHVKLDHCLPELNMYWFEGGYGGIQAIDSDTANICLWVKPALAQRSQLDLPELLEASLGKNRAARKVLSSVQPVSPIQTVGGIHHLHKRRDSSQSIMSIGDALLTVEPFSGFGMSHALNTGILAAETIDEGIRTGWPYKQILEKYLYTYHTHFNSHLFWLQWIRPIINRPLFQKVSWPILPPFLPLLTKIYR